MTAETEASERHRAPRDTLRWRCPAAWLRRLRPPSPVPALLDGRLHCQEALQLAAQLAGRAEPRHFELTVPPHPGWSGAVADCLRSLAPEGTPVAHASTPRSNVLRGRGKAGSLHEANRGLVVVDAANLRDDEQAWAALREAAELGRVTRLPEEGESEAPSDEALITLVLIGTEPVLKKLREEDPRFSSLITHRIEVARDIQRSREGVRTIAGMLRDHCSRGNLGDLSVGGLALLIEELARSSRRGRLALDLRGITETLEEARLLRGGTRLDSAAIRRAILQRQERQAQRRDSHDARIASGQLLVRSEGTDLGVVNGLIVYGPAHRRYSVPGRITASVAVGREGLINVEREAKFSGRSFDKGVYQLAGLLRSLYAQRSPLGLAATLTFEQSYGRIDGDSATLAETIALFSSLSGLPCRQDIAVSGAINLRGEVLPIGSATQKVEGWWRTCRGRGLTGSQGVLMPSRSLPELQLGEATLHDIEAGRFHVWAVEQLDDALELLLGRPAGRTARGFSAGSVYALAGRRMRAMSERLHPPRRAVKPGGHKSSAGAAKSPQAKPKPKPTGKQDA